MPIYQRVPSPDLVPLPPQVLLQVNLAVQKNAGHTENFSIFTKTLYRDQRLKSFSGLLLLVHFIKKLFLFWTNLFQFDDDKHSKQQIYIFMYIQYIYICFYMSVLHEVSTFDMVFSQNMTHTIIFDMNWYIRNID